MGAVKVSHGVESPAGYLVIREFLHGPEERMGMILKVFFLGSAHRGAGLLWSYPFCDHAAQFIGRVHGSDCRGCGAG